MWTTQTLNTPWDIVFYKRKTRPQYQQHQSYYSYQHQSTPVPPPAPVRCLLIAMAGLHQIWALYLDKTSSTCANGMKTK